jgi:crotonobetaine/carnitine-CoA ligase
MTPPAAHLGALTRRAAQQWGDRVAWVFDLPAAERTFTQVESETNQVANGLAREGVAPGEGVAILLPNAVEWPLAWLGIAKAGAYTVPVNTRYRSADARHLLAHGDVVAVVTDPADEDLANRVAELQPGLPNLRLVTSVANVIEGSSTAPPPVPLTAETLCNVQYTSGTTGLPKGCMLSHRWFCRLGQVAAEWVAPLGPEDVLLTAQPFSYVDPQWNIAAGLHCGGRVVVLDGFHPSTFWEKCRQHDATFFYCLGAMPTLMLEMPPSPSDRDHRVRVVSCSAIPPHRHTELEERFGVPWHELYGSTECGADIVVTSDDHDELVGTGLLGQPLPHREAVVVDADGRSLPRGQAGELLVRGLGMFDGYYRDPEATARAMADGWYHTGDLAVIDDEGRVRFAGRTKDMIRRGGENIAAAEVESVLQDHPAVKLAACVAVPDDLRQEEVKAFLVPIEGMAAEDMDLAGVAAYAEERLARFKVPRYWEVRTSLPMTPSQRVAKHDLAEGPPISGWDRTAS